VHNLEGSGDGAGVFAARDGGREVFWGCREECFLFICSVRILDAMRSARSAHLCASEVSVFAACLILMSTVLVLVLLVLAGHGGC
jgi:hypothetical protein